ncbi:MAG: SRPBCC family protein [Rhodobacteraceae bacterium]|nr:SRPBCC family protein [Paracoccaceae bacterium]
MELKARNDIEAPIGYTFDKITDFPGFERQALRRGAYVRRRDTLSKPGLGSAWELKFSYRGKDRVMRPTITEWEKPNGYVVKSISGGLEITATIDLMPLTPARTRLSITIDIVPKSLTARLLVQSLRLARGSLTKKLEARLNRFSRDIEARYS